MGVEGEGKRREKGRKKKGRGDNGDGEEEGEGKEWGTFMSVLVVTKFTDDLLVREIHLGMVSVDANGGCCLAVDVCSIRLLTLQCHPANGSAA